MYTTDEYGYMEFRTTRDRIERSRSVFIFDHDETGIPLPDKHYMAISHKEGGSKPHYCHTDPHALCDCNDFTFKEGMLCKHLIAALVYENDPLMMTIIQQVERENGRPA